MTHEVSLVFDKQGKAMRWSDGSAGYLPDSQDLWSFLWEHRKEVGGVAHTHPWNGPTGPSGTDITTFAALEKGLGLSLIWPIITMTHDQYFRLEASVGGENYIEVFSPFAAWEWWRENIKEMRRRSQGENNG